MSVWICIPVHNRVHFTLQCLECLKHQDFQDFRVVVCDDGSTDGTSQSIREKHPEVTLLEGDGNLWWTGGINRCVQYALRNANVNCDYILTLNDDLILPENFLSSLIKTAGDYPGAIVTSAVYDIKHPGKMVSPGWRQSWISSKATPLDPRKDHLRTDKSVASVTHASGHGTLIPVSIFREIGLYDEEALPHYMADYDFTHRARRAGNEILVCFNARVYSYVEETGLVCVQRNGFSWKSLHQYLTDMKSPANLRTRFHFAMNNCPRLFLATFLALDLFFVLGSYFKFHLKHFTSVKRTCKTT
jgi:GT2 family glycosyltransferase